MKLAFVLDPLPGLKAYKDSSIAMMREAARRNHEVYALEPGDMYVRDGAVSADVRRLEVSRDDKAWYRAGESHVAALASFDCVLMRKDPPFHLEYYYATLLLDGVQAQGGWVVNDPRGLRDWNEKLSILAFPHLIPRTLVTAEMGRVHEFIDQCGDVIVKKLDGMGGAMIFRVKRDDMNRNVIVETITDMGSRTVMAQKFVPEIAKGDKRVLVIDGKPFSHCLARIPKAGETRGNLAAGGRGVAQPISDRDREIGSSTCWSAARSDEAPRGARAMRIPVLTYHAMAMSGNDPRTNDHHALAADLETLDAHGFEIRPLAELVDAWLGKSSWFRKRAPLEGRRIVALTCDDGSDFDFRDLEHPQWGRQRSLLNILRDFRARHPDRQPGLSITSFVVVSPQARATLDRLCMYGRGWWQDDWWREAAGSGLMGIASHSWDHNHEALSNPQFPTVPRGTFTSIDTKEAADYQVMQAAHYLWARAPNPAARLFAYPYGPHSDYLVDEYFPKYAQSTKIDACFGDEARPWTAESNRWKVPRFVHGRDWHEPSELAKLLRDAA